MRQAIVGVMGPGDTATDKDQQVAYALGQLIAQEGWVLLTGGRNVGVMDAASRGAKQAGGLTVGILPDADPLQMSTAVDIPVITGMGSARNNINVLTSSVVVACGMSAGTASEVTLALKSHKKVVLLNSDTSSQAFFKRLSSDEILVAESPEIAIELVKKILVKSQS
jgi:uncharacterized protein (TIGR00725 family)